MPKGTTKSNGQKNANDKFYTKPSVALSCLEAIPGGVDSFDVWIEPSAGSGAFSSQVPGCLALDLAPEGDGILEQDWLLYERERDDVEKVLVFGNPPFGQQNSLAVKFINHAAIFADSIAFILPRSFKKPSVQNRLHPNLHLALEIDLPKNSFTLEGEDYGVPCVFQVWTFNPVLLRAKHVAQEPAGFSYVKRDEEPNFSIQRVGGRAGFADLDWQNKSVTSNYFIKLDNPLDEPKLRELIAELNSVSYPSRDHSVGPRSLSKDEVTKALNPLIAV